MGSRPWHAAFERQERFIGVVTSLNSVWSYPRSALVNRRIRKESRVKQIDLRDRKVKPGLVSGVRGAVRKSASQNRRSQGRRRRAGPAPPLRRGRRDRRVWPSISQRTSDSGHYVTGSGVA